MDQPAFHLELDRLRRQFADGLPARLTRLQEKWSALQQGEAGAIEPFYREVHNLAGACASYGLQPLGGEARQLEQLARPLLAEPQQLTATIEPLAEQLARVARLAEAPWPG